MKTLILISFLFSLDVLAGKALFTPKELDRLKRLKTGNEVMLQNGRDYEKQSIYDLYRTELLILSKVETSRRKGMTALKELDKIDQHFLFNKILDRKLRQKWRWQKKNNKKK